MAIRVLLFFIFCGYIAHAQIESCKPALDMNYIERNDFIVIARLYEDVPYNNGRDLLQVKKVYKGEHFNSDTYVIGIDTVAGLYFLPNVDYLIYAVAPQKGTHHLQLDSCTRTAPVSEAAEDISFLQNRLPCNVERSDVPCQRNLPAISICGCDGNDYPSACDARQAGIYVYTVGKCR